MPDSLMAAPLVHDERVLGVLEVLDPAPQSRSDLNLARRAEPQRPVSLDRAVTDAPAGCRTVGGAGRDRGDEVGSFEALIGLLVDTAPDAVVISRADGMIMLANQRAHEMFGYEPGTLLGRAVDGLVPDEIRPGHPVQRADYLSSEHPPLRRMPLRGRHRDGHVFPVEVSLSATAAPDGEMYVTAMLRDDTAHREVEQARALLASIVQSSHDAIVTTDQAGTVLSWNPGAERLYGHTATAMIGRSIEVVIPPERRTDEAEMRSLLRVGGRVGRYRTTRLHASARAAPLSAAPAAEGSQARDDAGCAAPGRRTAPRRRPNRPSTRDPHGRPRGPGAGGAGTPRITSADGRCLGTGRSLSFDKVECPSPGRYGGCNGVGVAQRRGVMTEDLSRRPLTGLLAAQLVSVLGTSMTALAIPWLVLTSTGSATRMGLIAFAEMAPYVAMQALGGPLVDRIGARRTYVLGNAAAAVAVCAVAALYTIDLLPLGALAGLVAVAGAVRGVADCAGLVLVPGVAGLGAVPLERAAGLHGSANQTGLFVGAPAAGIMVSVLGAPAVVLVDGITFALAALLVALLVPAAAQPQRSQRRLSTRRYIADLAEAVRFIRTDRLMLVLVAMILVTNLLDQGLNALLVPVWVREHLHRPWALGLIAGALGAGALIGALITAWLGPTLPRRVIFTIGVLIAGAPTSLVLALTSTLPPALTAAFVAGLAGGGLNPILNAVLYERIPPQLRARTLGALKASAWIGTPIGPLLAGSLIEATGLRTTLCTFAMSFLVATAVPLMLPAMRDMNRTPRPPRSTESVTRI